MNALIGIIGVLLIVVVLWDVFETIVLPRRVTRRVRLTRPIPGARAARAPAVGDPVG